MVDDEDEPSPLLELVGPLYAEPDVAEWLGIEVTDLQAMAGELTVLRLVTGDGTAWYPTWQFTADRTVIPHLPEVLRALARGSSERWTWALWLTADTEDDNRPIWQRLAADGGVALIIAEARADAARWVS